MGRALVLSEYSRKRNFTATPEPRPAHKKQNGHRFVVQRHWATREHFDLRLELNGVMVSWAVTRGPSADPADKRLAVKVEDHPVAYASFEGTIPKRQYGGGTVMIWDQGEWVSLDGDPTEALAEGKMKVEFHGQRLKGGYALIRMAKREKSRDNWLLIKERDAFARDNSDLPGEHITSVTTGRTRDQIAGGDGEARAQPDYIQPMLCKLVDTSPTGKGWLHEEKYDGYRLQIAKKASQVILRTRDGLDWTAKFPAIAAGAQKLQANSAIVDGEAVVFNKDRISDFPMLVSSLKETPERIEYIAFDVLFLDGKDLRKQSVVERKKILADIVPKKISHFAVSPYTLNNGAERFADSEAGKTEGVVSKRMDSIYWSGRGDSWLKAKHGTREDVFVVGHVPSENGRLFGALVSAVESEEALAYSGRVGSGFNGEEQKQILKILHKLEREGPSPLLRNPRLAPSNTKWVEPRMRIEVAMAGWTKDRQLRHPRFLSVRGVDPAAKVSRMKEPKAKAMTEMTKAASGAIVAITHPDRVVFPDANVTKQDIADYYEAVAPLMMPHLEERPLSFVRAPESIDKETFFQRHALNGMKVGIDRVPDPDGKHDDFVTIADRSGLRVCAQYGIVELHGWGSRIPHLENPDRMVFDLDPDEKVTFAVVKDAALHLRDMLREIELVSFPMLSGGKGMHVIVPLDASQDWDTIGIFTKGMARGLAESDPQHFIATASKAQRTGKIYVDWLRNKMSATAIVPWSLRARATASVAAPITWEELPKFKSPVAFTIKDYPTKNPWPKFFSTKQKIPAGAVEFLRGH